MKQGINRVYLLGNLGADPEVRTTQSSLVLHFRMATSSYAGPGKPERVEWHRVTVFGARAEPLEKMLRKGDPVAVEGSIHYSEYEKDGAKRTSTEIYADNVVLIGGKRSDDAAPRQSVQRQQPTKASYTPDISDDDIPF